ncbi:MAG: tyrosine-type recombinase/integrase [Verrucomicrobiales bacterium]
MRHSKSHQDYWKAKLRKRSYKTGDGQLVEIPEWQVRITFEKREAWFNCRTTNKAEAAIKARDIYLTIVAPKPAGGWEVALKKFKPESAKKFSDPTVGQFIEELEKKAEIKPMTFAIYTRKFRSLVAGIANIPDQGKHSYATGGYRDWLEKVHAVKLSKITPEKVSEWKVAFANREDPLQRNRAKITANSILRSSKALFSPKVIKHLAIDLPAVLPFAGVDLWKVKPPKYRSEISPALLSIAAHNELKPYHPELFKIFILALGAGLRRDEIDTLEWRHINAERGTIIVETTEHTEVKSHESQAEVDVDLDLITSLLEFKPSAMSQFVINSDVKVRHSKTYHHYRCQRHFRLLVKWLKLKGVRSRNALHTLRKEFGSIICAQAGIFQASAQLRHSDIRITRDSYISKNERVVVKLSVPEEPKIVKNWALNQRKPGRPEGTYEPVCDHGYARKSLCPECSPSLQTASSAS